jgi:hypothetical protein
VNSIVDALLDAEMLFPLFVSVMTYEVIAEPPFSFPTSAVQFIVAVPTSGIADGLSTLFGSVVGVAVREADDQALKFIFSMVRT